MRNRSFGIGVSALALLLSAPVAAQQTTVTSNAAGGGSTSGYFGQSFSFTGSAPVNKVQFSFATFSSPAVANGNLYLCSSMQTVTPAGLSGDTTNRVGVAAANAAKTAYVFDPNLLLNPNTEYYAYSDTSQSVAINSSSYANGSAYYTYNNSNFALYAGMASYQTGFRVLAAATPEPATWSLMILGFGMAGYALRRRARPVALAAA